MADVVKDFRKLLETEGVSESDVQNFLEKNSELVHTPFLLHHGLLYESLISKFPLDTGIITDFAYLTKCSDFWVLVLVEIEHPKKRIFTNNPRQITTSAEFNAALSQIHTWKEFLRDNKREVVRRLKPLLRCMGNVPVFEKYVLVIGRRKELECDEGRRNRLATYADDVRVLAYDSLITAFESGPHLCTDKNKKNILALTKGKYRFKYLYREPTSMFAFLRPEHLELTARQKTFLIERGLEIHKWEKGRLLRLDGKRVL